MEKYQISTMENIVLCILAAVLGSLVKQIIPDNLVLWMLSYIVLFVLLYTGYRWIRTKLAKKSKGS